VLREMSAAGARFFQVSTAKVETLKIVAEGDTVVVRQRMSCKAVNGRDYCNDYVWIFSCEGGRIVRMEEHTDSLYFQRTVLDP
jgi:ketosteroid isomerase-like protein